MQLNCDRNRLASIFSNLLISTWLHIISYGGGGGGGHQTYTNKGYILQRPNVQKKNPKRLSQ